MNDHLTTIKLSILPGRDKRGDTTEGWCPPNNIFKVQSGMGSPRGLRSTTPVSRTGRDWPTTCACRPRSSYMLFAPASVERPIGIVLLAEFGPRQCLRFKPAQTAEHLLLSLSGLLVSQPDLPDGRLATGARGGITAATQ